MFIKTFKHFSNNVLFYFEFVLSFIEYSKNDKNDSIKILFFSLYFERAALKIIEKSIF